VLYLYLYLGGVNHCRSRCRLARFRGLMIGGKYGAVIGRKTRILYVPSINFQAMGSCKPITAPYFPPIIKPRNLAELQSDSVNYLQWLTPPMFWYQISLECVRDLFLLCLAVRRSSV